MPRHHGCIDCNYGYQCLNPLHYVLHMRDDASEEEIQLAQQVVTCYPKCIVSIWFFHLQIHVNIAVQRLQDEVAERLNKCLADVTAPEGERGFAGLSDCRCLKVNSFENVFARFCIFVTLGFDVFSAVIPSPKLPKWRRWSQKKLGSHCRHHQLTERRKTRERLQNLQGKELMAALKLRR